MGMMRSNARMISGGGLNDVYRRVRQRVMVYDGREKGSHRLMRCYVVG